MKNLIIAHERSQYVMKGLVKAGSFVFVEGGEMQGWFQHALVNILATRVKAVDFSNQEPIVSYDTTSKEFNRIMMRAGSPDSQCSCGPEFLLLVDDALTTYFAGGRVAKQEMMPLMPIEPKTVCTMRTKKIGNRSFTWYTPHVTRLQFHRTDIHRFHQDAIDFLDTNPLKVGQKWRRYDGIEYEITGVGDHENSPLKQVICKSLTTNHIYIINEKKFFEEMGNGKPRFKRVS